jgi:hypothetical protein
MQNVKHYFSLVGAIGGNAEARQKLGNKAELREAKDDVQCSTPAEKLVRIIRAHKHFLIDSFSISSCQKIGPLRVPVAPIHHGRLTNHVLTLPMIERLLCSLVDKLDQTKLGINLSDVNL